MRRSWYVILAALGLTGCASPPQPPPGIIIARDNRSQAEIVAHARQYCAEYDAWPIFDTVNYGTLDPLLSYDCN